MSSSNTHTDTRSWSHEGGSYLHQNICLGGRKNMRPTRVLQNHGGCRFYRPTRRHSQHSLAFVAIMTNRYLHAWDRDFLVSFHLQNILALNPASRPITRPTSHDTIRMVEKFFAWAWSNLFEYHLLILLRAALSTRKGVICWIPSLICERAD